MAEKKKKTNSKKSSKDKKPKKAVKQSSKKLSDKKVKADEVEEVKEEKKPEKKEKRKILYVEIDDEVTAVYDRIKSLKQKNLYLVIPKRAIIFQSIVNLKILKRKAEDLSKQISIITSDSNGTHLANMIELPVYDSIHTNLASKISKSDAPDIAPMKATVNTISDVAPIRLKKRKLSIPEFLHSFRQKHGMKTTPIRSRKKSSREKKNQAPKSKLVWISPNRQALVSLIIASLMIFLVIAYIALPGATIYLTPKSTVLEKSVNITLADFVANRSIFDTHPEQMIASYPANHTYAKSITYSATGKIFKGANASGKITIINENGTARPLVIKTRFQSPNGIIYRLRGPVTVPPKRGDQNGSLEVTVYADEFDAYNQIVGDRGNIGPTQFFLPALRPDNQAKLYAKSSEPMTGGFTNYTKVVTEGDIEAAQNILIEEMKKESIDALQAKITEEAKAKGSQAKFSLLIENKAIEYSDPRMSIAEDLIDKQVDQFDIRGEIDITGIYFNYDELIEILRNELMLKKSPEKRIVKIEDESIVYSIFDQDKAGQKVRVTATIKGIEEYEIDPEKENGNRLTKIIKEHILGKKISEAKSYIQNLPEINKVEIESWPGWAPTIPSVPDNIEIVIRD